MYIKVLKTESRYKNKLTAESCFHLHKILDSVLESVILDSICFHLHPLIS